MLGRPLALSIGITALASGCFGDLPPPAPPPESQALGGRELSDIPDGATSMPVTLWDLEFSQDRCPNVGTNTVFQSRRVLIRDLFGGAICAGKLLGLRIQLSLAGGAAPSGYIRVFQPTPPEPDVIQFMNTPQVSTAVLSVFRDTNGNNRPDPTEARFGTRAFVGALGTADNLCPVASSDTATLILTATSSDLPGSC